MPIMRRRQPRAQAALALAALLLIPAAGCKRAPASPSRPVATDQHSQPAAAASSPGAAPAPVQVPVQGPRFAVQVAAFNDRPSAESLASRLSEHFGLQTMVAPVESNGVTHYRVRILVGSKDEADKLAETFLHTENLKVWIVPL
jgi:cell division protein FtsN